MYEKLCNTIWKFSEKMWHTKRAARPINHLLKTFQILFRRQDYSFCLKVTLVNETVFCCCLVSNSIFGFANVSEIRLLCTDINKQTTHKHTIVYYLWVAHFDTLHIVMSHKSNSFRWLAENNESSESSPVHLFSVLFNAKFRIEKGVEADK